MLEMFLNDTKKFDHQKLRLADDCEYKSKEEQENKVTEIQIKKVT